MKVTTLITTLLLLLTTGLFAQGANPLSTLGDRTVATTGGTSSTFLQNARQWIVGRWDLQQVNGQTTANGQAVQGYVEFTTNNIFSGELFGDQGNGTYTIVRRNNQTILEVVEEGALSQITIIAISANRLTLLADRVELEFTK